MNAPPRPGESDPVVPYERHVFVCVNRRSGDAPRGCCASKGGESLRDALKSAVKARRVPASVRVNGALCLDFCEQGATVCVYPENVWYGGVVVADVAEIVESHLVGGKPVDRLRIAPRILAGD